jgi:hypothetical protein
MCAIVNALAPLHDMATPKPLKYAALCWSLRLHHYVLNAWVLSQLSFEFSFFMLGEGK